MTTLPIEPALPSRTLTVEENGINVIDESERQGAPRSLFWPWCAANISVLGIAYGSFLLGFEVSLWQASVAAVLGIVVSFFLCGLVALAGQRGSAPTMIASRAAFGVRGNTLPAFVSWVLLVGWETVLAALAVLATSTVMAELGLSGGTAVKVIAFGVVAILVIGAGVLGFDAIMRLQRWITLATAVLTVAFMVLTFPQIDWAVLQALPAGSSQAFLGVTIFAMTGFGLGWVNSAADYSRYLPRSASRRGVVGWTTLGGAAAPLVLVGYGLLLAGSDPALNEKISADPVGALATVLPSWFLVPFAVVAVLGMVGGAVLDIYSSGLTLLSMGVRVPRWGGVLIDGVLMAIGTVYIVFVADDFLTPFQGFLYLLGVPVAAWAGVMVADVVLRRTHYAETELYDPQGRYGSVNWVAVGLMLLGTWLGWGLVVNGSPEEVPWLNWQGYLMDVIGGKKGDWAYANVGVLVALVVGLGGWLLVGRAIVRRQEALAASPSSPREDV